MFHVSRHTFLIDPIQFDPGKFVQLDRSMREIAIRHAFDLYLDRMEAFRRQQTALRPHSIANVDEYEISPTQPTIYLEVSSVEGSLNVELKVIAASLAFLVGAAWLGVTEFPRFKAGIIEMCDSNNLFGSCVLRDYMEENIIGDHQIKRRRHYQPELRRILQAERDVTTIDSEGVELSEKALMTLFDRVFTNLRYLRRRLPLNSDFVLVVQSILAERTGTKISLLRSMIAADPELGPALEKEIVAKAFKSIDGYDNHLLTDREEIQGYECRIKTNTTGENYLRRDTLITMPLLSGAASISP